MTLFRRLFMFLCVVLTAASCNKDGVENNIVTAISVSLVKNYYSGVYYKDASIGNGESTIWFSDNSELKIPGEIIVKDCKSGVLPSIIENTVDKVWKCNGTNTDIPVRKDVATMEASIVCVAFTEEQLHIYLNNGVELTIPDCAEHSLFTFRLDKNYNMSLPETVVCSIDGLEVKGQLPDDVLAGTFIPTFEYRGKLMKVNGVEQRSRRNSMNFKNPVTYSLELYDGTTVDYVVTLTTGLSFPAIHIDTDNKVGIYSKDEYVSGRIRIEDPDKVYSDVEQLESRMQIKGRGNSSWDMPKKPYRIKLAEKQKVFGVAKNKSWVLLANYSDKSLLRNMVAFKLSEICEMPWTPAIFSVDVYLNDSYIGLYNLTEHKEVAKNRVDIDVVKPADNSGETLTGGYYFEIETRMDEKVCFQTGMGVPMMFKDPEEPTSAQQTYIKQYFKDFENELKSIGTTGGGNYAEYIDVDTFVNYYIIEELLKNIDGNLRKSTFLTKERGRKLRMYHVWDHDLVLGNCNYFNAEFYPSDNSARGWYVKDYGAQGKGYGWYVRLFRDPAFASKVKARWHEVYPRLLEEVPAYIEEQAKFMAPAANRNFKRWDILSYKVWPNVVALGNWLDEVAYMKKFYLDRLAWINSNIDSI